MQRMKDNQEARGPTAEEFQHVAKQMLDDARAQFLRAGFNRRPVLSMDNARIHTSARLSEVGISFKNNRKLPARSPDLHRVSDD